MSERKGPVTVGGLSREPGLNQVKWLDLTSKSQIFKTFGLRFRGRCNRRARRLTRYRASIRASVERMHVMHIGCVMYANERVHTRDSGLLCDQ